MRTHWPRIFRCWAVMGSLLGLLVAGWVVRCLPEIHEGMVHVEVAPDQPEDRLVLTLPEGVDPETYVVPWVTREMNWITSRESFAEVIVRLELDKRWKVDRESAHAMLGGNVVARSVRGTHVVSIRVRHADSGDAADVARELVGVYQEHSMDGENRRKERVQEELRRAIREQEEEVDVSRVVLAESERMRMKNIRVGETRTLLHIPESPEHQMARQSLAQGERMLQLLMEKMRYSDDERSSGASRPELFGHSRVSVRQISPNVPFVLIMGPIIGLGLSLPVALGISVCAQKTRA